MICKLILSIDFSITLSSFFFTYFFLTRIFLLTIHQLFAHSQMVPSIAISNDSNKQSFVYTKKFVYVQTVLFRTIQFSVCHLFAHGLNVKQFY